MIKVYHVIKSLGRGGAEMLLPETLRVHDREQFDFRYAYFLPHKGQVAEDLREIGAEVDCLGGSNSAAILAKVPALARLARDWGADLLHCHLPVAGIAGRLAGKLGGIPVVYTEHNKQERYHALTRRLNLDELVTATSELSRYHFIREYKRQTGQTPMQAFQRIKVSHACYLLDISDDTLARIAARLGYDDPYYFSRLFKKVMGVSPGHYRRERGRLPLENSPVDPI